MTRLWTTKEELTKLVAGLLASTKSDEEKISEAAKLGIRLAQKASDLRTEHGTLDAGLVAALEQRSIKATAAPRVVPGDPLGVFIDAVIKSGRNA